MILLRLVLCVFWRWTISYASNFCSSAIQICESLPLMCDRFFLVTRLLIVLSAYACHAVNWFLLFVWSFALCKVSWTALAVDAICTMRASWIWKNSQNPVDSLPTTKSVRDWIWRIAILKWQQILGAFLRYFFSKTCSGAKNRSLIKNSA